jgi:hypothetical protein
VESCCLHHPQPLTRVAHALQSASGQQGPTHQAVPSLEGTTRQAREEAARQRRHARAQEVDARGRARRAQPVDGAKIARQVGVSRQTGSRSLRLTPPPPRTSLQVARPPGIDPCKPYVTERWTEGGRHAWQLWRERRDRGCPPAARAGGRFVAAVRKARGPARSFRQVSAGPSSTVGPEQRRPLTALQAARRFPSREEQRSAWQDADLTRLGKIAATIARTSALVQTVAAMVRQRPGAALDPGIKAVQERGLAERQAVADGVRNDSAAGNAGLRRPWSTGHTEAQSHSLHLLKRPRDGQAGVAWRRRRVWHRAPPLPVHLRATNQRPLLAA